MGSHIHLKIWIKHLLCAITLLKSNNCEENRKEKLTGKF